ncbi:MAG TPA: DUF1993 domain-containing protein [Casimicrobiaceae bacterium]
MTISMYQASVAMFIRMLTSLKGILEKGAAYAQARKIEEPVLLNARLYPDMFAFTRQVQIACDFARGTGARLAGTEPPAYEDKEQTFAELVARVERSIAYLRTLTAGEIDGSEGREIVRPIRGEPKKFTGINYLLQFALPNFFFHVTTVYAILRHNGVELGKADFIGTLD